MYILYPKIGRMEMNICKHLYWYEIRKDILKEFSNCDTCQGTKKSNIKNGKLSAKVYETFQGS